MRGNKWTVRLVLSNGIDNHTVALPVPEDVLFTGMTPRFREELEMAADAGVSLVPVDMVAHITERKVFRRRAFIDWLRQLGDHLASDLEDKEGWQAVDRAKGSKGAAQDA